VCLSVLPFLHGIAFGEIREMQVLVSTDITDEVLRIDGLTGKYIDRFEFPGVGVLDNLRGLLLGPDGLLYVCSPHSRALARWNPITGKYVGSITSLDIKPLGITLGPDNRIYYSNVDRNNIYRMDTSAGGVGVKFIADDAGGLDNPFDLTFGPDGNLYVCCRTREGTHIC
jgi:streptogramin lyase